MDSIGIKKTVSWEKITDRSLLLILSITTLVLLISVWFFFSMYHKRSVRQNVQRELTRYADSLVGQQLQGITYVLKNLAANGGIIQLAIDQGGQTPKLEKYLTGIAAGSGASIVYILDTEGEVIGCSRYGDNKTLLGKNYAFREYFLGAIQGRDVVFPAVGVTTNERGFYFSTPVYTDIEKTSLKAVAVIKMGVQRIEEVLQSMDSPSGIVTPLGIVFISNKNNLLFTLTRDMERKELNNILKSRQFGNKVLEKIPESYLPDEGFLSLNGKVVEKMELLFPGWHLVQWRAFRYPYESAIAASVVATVIISFSGLLIVGKRKRLQKDKELKVAKETAEENLRKGYETLRHILKTSPVAVFVCDQRMKVSWLNKTARNMLELSSYDEAKSYVFGESIDVVDDDGNSLIKKNGQKKIINVEGILKDDKETEIPVLLNRTSFHRGEELLYLYSFLDLAERKQMEAELVHTRKMESIGQLASGIAHEINSPAQFVGSNIDFIIEALPDLFSLVDKLEAALVDQSENLTEETHFPEETVSGMKDEADYDYLHDELPVAARQSREGIERISKIVLAMKAFSHPGDSNAMQTADINNAIETTLTVAANEWKGVTEVELDLADNLPTVPCLIGELNQVFLNLIVNGAHAIEELQSSQDKFQKGLLKITTSAEDDFVKITFSDSGTGIAQEHRDKVFDPFFTTKEVGRGSGQGLYIARTLIHEQHNGTLTFDTIDGEGTTFTIRLPVREEKMNKP